jgi:DNA-directed RNA polymerase specialized sigma24 family protein
MKKVMQALTSGPQLARLAHDELLRLLAANPRHQQAAGEFMARYHTMIRQIVASTICKRMANAGYETIQTLIEDAVGETYYRLFQNDGQALRSFRSQHPNSIFSYLQTIAFSAASNQIRAHHRHAGSHIYSLDKLETQPLNRFAGENTAAAFGDFSGNQTIERRCFERTVRVNLRRVFRAAHVNRNFILFKLHFLYGYHSDEIAHIKGLGFSEKGASNTTTRIRCWFKQGKKRTGKPKNKTAKKTWVWEELTGC